MIPEPIHLDDERLIREGEIAVDLYNKDTRNARTRIMPMARGLLAAKRKFPATQDFGDWLQGSSYRETEKDDRAALIKIGEHDSFSEKFVRTTALISPQTIWDAIEGLLPTSYHTNSTAETLSFPQPTPPNTPVAESDEPPKNEPMPPTPKLTQRSGLYGVPRGEELARMFQSKDARSALGRVWRGRGGKQIWELILTALDAGLITPNNRSFDKPTLSLLFPPTPVGIAKQYDLSNQKQRTHIRDILLPKMIACRDKLLAEPERTREILNEYDKEHHTQRRQAVVAEKREVAVKALPVAEQELMMFGQTVWPRLNINQGEYDYDQVRAAIWTFRDYEAWNQMAKENTGSHALRIRNSLRYLGEYLQRTNRDNPMAKIFGLIAWFSYLMEKNPTGQCKWPAYPHIEGQW